jgi:hypothetical protein
VKLNTAAEWNIGSTWTPQLKHYTSLKEEVNSGNEGKEERVVIIFTVMERRLCFDGVAFIIFGVKQHSLVKMHIQLS